MPRSLQHFGVRAEAPMMQPTTMSMTAATSPWRQPAAPGFAGARHAARPSAASFSAGDSHSHHQTMLAFERQLDALVDGGEENAAAQHVNNFSTSSTSSEMMEQRNARTFERNLSISSVSSLPAFGSNTNNNSRNAIKANLKLNVGTKITGRRHRTPRRFVVTDIPDFDDFGHTSPMKNDPTLVESHRHVTTHQQRQGKTEVKGRFTIIDLSPESPHGSPPVQRSPVAEFISRGRHGDTPRKKGHRKVQRSLQLVVDTASGANVPNTFRTESPKTPANGSQNRVTYLDPVDTSSKTRRVDLNVFDRHLDHLQKESAEMKSLLEGMVSTNARWISALSQAGVVFPVAQNNTAPGFTDASEVVAPAEPERAAAVGSSIEEKYAAMELAYMELQKKHDALLAKNQKLEEQKEKLESNLQHEIQVSKDLRAQLRHLSQYTGNLIFDSERSNEYMFGDQSTVDVDDQSPVATDFSGDYDFQYQVRKDRLFGRRRRRYIVDEECMSDTSSEGSIMKSRSRTFDDDDNNIPFSESDDDFGRDAKPYLLTANRFEHFMFHHDAYSMNGQIKKDDSSDEDELMGMDSIDPLASSTSDAEDLQVSNQLGHGSSTFKYLKRDDSLSSLIMNNYSTVSSNSSIASFGVQVAALTKSVSGTFMTPESLLARQGSPTNQTVDAKEKYTSLSTENLFFHNSRSSGKGLSSFGLDPHEDPALQGTDDDEAQNGLPSQLYRQTSYH
uniref:Uncharacterized protein n=1 Tax=Globisporangium ultimum (strain ATCC 200006 / CBS 805.95 / DAOM BR144) TaxID=431595 RepID=K3WG55_GLOUD